MVVIFDQFNQAEPPACDRFSSEQLPANPDEGPSHSGVAGGLRTLTASVSVFAARQYTVFS